MTKKINKNIPKLRFSEFKDDWEETTLGKASIFYDKQRIPLSSEERQLRQGQYPYYGASGVIDSVDDYIFDGSYILLAEDGANILSRSTPIAFIAEGKFWVNNHAHILRSRGSNKFLTEYLENLRFDEYNTGTVQPKLNSEICKKIKIRIPSIAEQEKIASFLGAIDTRLTQLRRKHKLLQTYKRGVIREIFIHKIGSQKNKKTPSFRFNSFAGEWQPRKFKEFIVKKNTNASENIPLYSLTIENGVTEKTERYERSFLIKSEDEAYKLVESNDFVYNPMNVRLGALARHKKDYSVKVSKYYDVFSLDQSVDIDFVELLLKNRNSIQYYDHMAAGSLIEKKRLHFVDFLQFTFLLPCIEEQEKIADFLTAIDQKIEAVARQVDRTEQFKKGLLQKMFV